MNSSEIAYTSVICDLLHFGQVNILQKAKKHTGYLIVGLLTENAASKNLVSNFEERKSVLEELKCVDEVILQDDFDPTNNLKNVVKNHPDSKIYLFHGDDWDIIPGADYVESIGGEVVTIPYYKRLDKNRINITFKEPKEPLISTKAKTLNTLRQILTKSRIEECIFFTVSEWEKNPEKILNRIRSTFPDIKLVVRSSSISEDGYNQSNAGCFHSALNVTLDSVGSAIDQVRKSYDENPNNEILVQTQTEDVEISGVVFTRKLDKNAPYYVINYDDTGSTDSITSGKADNKIEIIRSIKKEECSDLWFKLIESIREIESYIPHIPLDIEFAITSDKDIVIFQVRPLAANEVLSDRIDSAVFSKIDTITTQFDNSRMYSDMAFWNPSEIIGTSPKKLDYSLYKYLITDNVWNTALSSIGYNDVNPSSLMIEFGGKPYIDLHLSFTSLLPQSLPDTIKNKLISYYKKKIRKKPELHDKIEFYLVHNCYHENIDEDLKELLYNGFSQEEVSVIKQKLKQLTENIIEKSEYWFTKTKDDIACMEKNREKILTTIDLNSVESIINMIQILLDDCLRYGTINFSRIARFAFISNIYLKSLLENGTIDNNTYDDFFRTISAVRVGGHLREGTYDITSPIYDKSIPNVIHDNKNKTFTFLGEKERFIRKSIELRELVKFEFTKNLSLSIELIANLGKILGYTRKELANLDIKTILSSKERDKKDIIELWSIIIDSRKKIRTINEKISLPPLIYDKTDFKFIKTYISKPNFITNKKIAGEISHDLKDIENKIVMIKNADPGYDWIFSRKIKGLVTCYGGVASHMAIRCAEFGIPAAIGCGTKLFEELINKESIEINCKEERII